METQATSNNVPECGCLCIHCAGEFGLHCHVTGYDGAFIRVGDRVEIHPACDLWMQGARYGTVKGLSITADDAVKVSMDKVGMRSGSADLFRLVEVAMNNLTAPTLNDAKLRVFADVYSAKLLKAVTEHQEEYAYNVSEVPSVACRMILAIERRTFNKDSRAIRDTCRVLSLAHTYKAIYEFLESA